MKNIWNWMKTIMSSEPAGDRTEGRVWPPTPDLANAESLVDLDEEDNVIKS